MIQALSKHMSEYMFCNQMNKESFEVHLYGIEVIISTLINTVLILLIGMLFQRVDDAIIYILGFYIIRKFCGGYHCQTYAKCISLHVLLFCVYLLTYTCYEGIKIYISIGSIISFCMLLCLGASSVNAKEFSKNKELENLIKLNELLKDENINIEEELKKLVDEYQNLYDNTLDNETKLKFLNLEDGVSLLLEEYRSSKKLRANPPNAAVVSVAAYFNNKGYDLAKELLVQATLNTNKNSTYKPANGSVVKSSSAFRNIALGTQTSGSSIFLDSGSVEERDCYYAIKKFDYKKSSSSTRSVTIKDYYDFAKGDYSGIAGIAVNAMYYAQQNGSIVPYNVEILSSYNPNYQSIVLE